MVDPSVGVASGNEFFSLAAVKEWTDAQPEFQPFNRAEHRLLLPEPVEIVSPEERARRVAMLKGVAQQIRETVKAVTVGRPEQIEWVKPTKEQSEAQKRETEKFAQTQAKDRSALLQTDLVKNVCAESDAA